MIERILSQKIKALSKKFYIVSVMGPRQSGKTTLVKNLFPKAAFVSLEDADVRRRAEEDPRDFLHSRKGMTIIDEAQRVPHLFSYVQTLVDERAKPGQFIFTGSLNYLLMQNITQSLAGRVAIVNLMPFSMNELANAAISLRSLEHALFNGFYPAVIARKISPVDWFPGYITTYLERDVRQLQNLGDLSSFQKFLSLVAAHAGQILNLSSLGNDAGISHNTAKAWLSILESSFIIFYLQPYHQNFRKRIVKSPKLYFYDTGLVCNLLGITNHKQLEKHPFKGALVENLVISELKKNSFNAGMQPSLFYWKNKTGQEIDCIIHQPSVTTLVEIKAGKTVNSDYFKGIKYFRALAKNRKIKSYVVYGGDQDLPSRETTVLSWRNISAIK